MADEKVAAGQKVAGSALRSAAVVNDLLDMRHRFKSGGLDSRGRGKEVEPLGTDLVMVKNSSGAARERGEALQLGDFLLTTSEETDNKWNLWFDGDTPATPLLRCVILQKPAPEDEIVEAHGQGVCVAKVNVVDTDHTHASPTNGQHYLTSGNNGLLELLSPAAGTGQQLMAARFITGVKRAFGQFTIEVIPSLGSSESLLTFGDISAPVSVREGISTDGSTILFDAAGYYWMDLNAAASLLRDIPLEHNVTVDPPDVDVTVDDITIRVPYNFQYQMMVRNPSGPLYLEGYGGIGSFSLGGLIRVASDGDELEIAVVDWVGEVDVASVGPGTISFVRLFDL